MLVRSAARTGHGLMIVMDDQVRFTVDLTPSLATVRAHGPLVAAAGPGLRAEVVACLAAQPGAVLVDLTRATGVDDVVLSGIATLGRESLIWPGVPIVVSGASPSTIAAAHRVGLAPGVAVHTDATISTGITGLPDLGVRRLRIAPDQTAARTARSAVHSICLAQGLGGDVDVAALVATELVTNAVVHAGTMIDLSLRIVPPLLHIAVRDGGAGQPEVRYDAAELVDGGRGLMLVETLAAQWGCLRSHRDTVVWAQVRVRPSPRSS